MSDSSKFPRLFSPGSIGQVELRNRIIFPAFEKCYSNVDGSVTQRYVDYVEERAKGGCALLIAESAYVHPSGRTRHYQLGIHADELIPGHERLAAAGHKHGMKVGLNLQHGGRQNTSSVTGLAPVGPSNVPFLAAGGEAIRELSIAEIKDVVEAYARAAGRVKRARYDLVEIHGAHGYLVNSFFSPYTNRRTDRYGGSLENRMRFPLEIVDAVRQTVGTDYPIIYRVSADEYIEGGNTLAETQILAQRLASVGVDALNVSGGIAESAIWVVPPMDLPAGSHAHLAAGIKAGVNIPVIAVGRIFHPALAEKILAEGKADFVAMGRPLHADPYLPRKAKEGRLDEILHCTGCNQGCTDLLVASTPTACVVNPSTGRERDLAIQPVRQKKRVIVVGGGPAGMMAAQVAARRGHEVTLYEKTGNLGGQIRLAAMLPHKGMYRWMVRDLQVQMAKAGVKVVLGTEVTTDLIRRDNPEAVIVATGASPVILGIEGAAQNNVVTDIDVLEGRVKVGNRVVVYRGRRKGCQLAEHLARDGREIIVLEPTAKVMSDAGFSIVEALLGRVAKNPQIQFRINTTLEEIQERSVIVQTDTQRETISDVDTVIFSWAMAENNRLADELKASELVKELYTIGDCSQARTALEATREGFEAGLRL